MDNSNNIENSYVVVIPARMASTRLPRKPLIEIFGKTMIQRTCEQVAKVVPIDKIIVATDDIEILNHVNELGYKAILTSESCLTGTDRVAEIARQTKFKYYINVQGDEPIINPDDISKIIDSISLFPTDILNGYTAINNEEDYISTTIPKVVFDNFEMLMYMSRAPIPASKSFKFVKAWRQICIYSFPRDLLIEFSNSTKKAPLEEIEDIEILRFVEFGHKVKMVKMSDKSIAVDVYEDIEKVKNRLNEQS